MKDILLRADECTRRDFVSGLARSLLGVSLLPVGGAAAALGAPAQLRTAAKAKSVIYLFMEGGMSHIDTFDPKPAKKDVQGPVGAIKTSADGIQVTEYLPNIAKQMHHCALIRSMSHTQGNHEPGQYKLRTGHEHQAGIIHPSLGAWVSRLRERNNPNLPAYIRVGDLAKHPGSGFFESKYAPLPISNPEDGLSNSKLQKGVTEERLMKNLSLSTKLDAEFRRSFDHRDVRAYGDLYTDAIRMMSSADLDAFDITKETAEKREEYGGKDRFAQGVLLARRLVERGVQFVEVDLGGWDSHTDNHKQVAEKAAVLDRTLSTLLKDLEGRGLLETTLVVLATEFGRSPEIDQYLGRNHHPIAFTCMLAGGGIKGGQVYGASDDIGKTVAEKKVSVHDFHATIAHCMGLNTQQLFAPFEGAQKFSIIGKDTGDKGVPINALL